jgi:hypothetical protein
MKNKVIVELQHDFSHVYYRYYFVIECLSFGGKMNVLDIVLCGCVRNWVKNWPYFVHLHEISTHLNKSTYSQFWHLMEL